MLSKQTTIAVVLSIIMVMSAGCAGWGTDGPANPDKETDGNGEVQTNESPGDSQETESDDSGTEEEQQGGEENSDTSTSTDPTEESSSEANTDKTDANGPSETDDGETVDSTEETETTDETRTDSSQTGSDQGDESPSSNGDDDNDDESPASGGNDENGGGGPPEDGGGDDGDSDENGDEGPTNGNDNGANGNGDDGDDENGEQVTCDAFGTQEEAQEYFDENPEERGHLDENDDGIPCEHLPSESNGDEEVYTLTVEADSPVTLERTWEDASTTREPTNGTVEFSVIEGSYTLSAEGYYDIPEELALNVDSDMTIALQNEDGEEIEVNVVDAETGDGIEGAEISGVCNWYYSSGDVYITGETNEDGVANAHAGLSPTECDAVTISADGYEEENVNLSVPEDDGVTVELEPEASSEGDLSVVDMNIDQEEQDTENEWILFRNTGDGTLDLTGWTVEDSSRVGVNLNPFQFPSMTLESGEEVRLITGDGEDTDDTVYWGIGNPIWNHEGDTVIARNAAGDVVLNQYIEAPENGNDNSTNDEDTSTTDDGGDENGDEAPANDNGEDENDDDVNSDEDSPETDNGDNNEADEVNNDSSG